MCSAWIGRTIGIASGRQEARRCRENSAANACCCAGDVGPPPALVKRGQNGFTTASGTISSTASAGTSLSSRKVRFATRASPRASRFE